MDYSRVISSLVRCAPWSSVLLLIQMVELTVAKALPALSCDVSAQADGTFLHMLSASFGLECSPGWEDINRTAITQVSEVAQSQVQNLTVRSLTLRRCLDFTRFTATCPDGVWTEAVCRFNCSSALSVVDSVTRFCVSGTCLDPVVVVLLVVAAVVLLAGFLIYKKIQQKHKRREKSAALKEEEERGLELLSKE